MNIQTIKGKIDELDKRLPVRETLLLPSDIFFTRLIPLPEGTLPTEISSFAQLQVEAIAPFPIENLSWGYSTDGKNVLIYASTQDRAASFAPNGLDKVWNAFPAFLPFVIQSAPAEDTAYLAIGGGSASLLSFRAGETLPFKIQSCRIAGETPLSTDEEILASRPAILAGLCGADTPKVEEGVRYLQGVNDHSDTRTSFITRKITGATPAEAPLHISISGEPLWNADIRGRVFATATSDQRKQSSILWKAFAAACIAACVLVFATIGLAAVKTTGAVYRAIVKHHASEVELLQNKADFAGNLESVTEREMKPFSMLALANSKRPAGVYYDQASTTSWNTLHLSGGAQRSELIQGYIEDLGKDPNVHEVRTLRTATSGGSSTFDIEIVFNPLEDATAGN
jgi:hypothetical protein